jgi:nodulation protein E
MNRVVVTGIGVVSALGNNAAEFWESISSGRSGIGPLTNIDASELRIKNVAEARNFDAAEYFEEKELMFLDPFAQFGIAAAREAVVDSGIEFKDGMQDRVGVVTGSCLGGKETEDKLYAELYGENRTRFPPATIPRAMSNAVASQLSMEFGLTGATFTNSTASSSANHAIGQAFWLIRQGTLDAAIAGGSEAPLALGNLRAWESMRVVSPDTCRPFSKDRSGMILGEGGAMLVLENLEAAKARGAKIYAELAGFGMSADAHHLTMPLAEGAARAMRGALADAGLNAERVGYVNAHGTATQANDVMESGAIRQVFGDHAGGVFVSSTKSMHGHALGAAGAIEAAATVLGMHNGLLPPTANFNDPDPACDVNVIRNQAIEALPEVALSNSFAFGGLNAVLAFKRWQG